MKTLKDLEDVLEKVDVLFENLHDIETDFLEPINDSQRDFVGYAGYMVKVQFDLNTMFLRERADKVRVIMAEKEAITRIEVDIEEQVAEKDKAKEYSSAASREADKKLRLAKETAKRKTELKSFESETDTWEKDMQRKIDKVKEYRKEMKQAVNMLAGLRNSFFETRSTNKHQEG